MQVNAQDVLNFIVARNNASEDKPLVLGNVEFWHPVPGFPVGLCYSIPTATWDKETVQADLNRYAGECWEELVAHLQEKANTAA